MFSTETITTITSMFAVCHDTGEEIVETCRAIGKADDRLAGDVMRAQADWLRFETQLQIAEKAVLLMDSRHRHIMQHALRKLYSKLQPTNSRLSEELRQIEAKVFMFDVARDSLADAISELERCRVTFDLAWYLLIMTVNPQIDIELSAMVDQTMATMGLKDASSVLSDVRDLRGALNTNSESLSSTVILQQGSLYPGTAHPIPFSDINTVRLASTGQIVLLDPVTYSSWPSEQAAIKDARTFALRLRNADPFQHGLLECVGILKNDQDMPQGSSDADPMLAFVYRLPEKDICVESLWGRLRGGKETEHESLSERFTLARQLAQAVIYTHVHGLVHKNIRPENILLFSRADIIDLSADTTNPADQLGHSGERDDGPNEFCALVGFDIRRIADSNTQRVDDDDWRKNLYRHPSTQGKTPKAGYDMRHDIYSVGVCLLEIGLWESFVRSDGWSASPSADECTLASVLGYGDMEPAECFEHPDGVKDQLLRLSRNELKRRMGKKYSKVVETCLTCLDDGNEEFGDELPFRDEEGVAVGVEFIDRVVSKLADIVV